MAFTQIEITQDFTSADWTEPSGTVTFTPAVPMLNGGVVVPAVPVKARLDGGGMISISLAAVTDSSTSPQGNTYRVDENINGVKRSYSISVPHNQGATLILYDLAQVATPPAVSFPAASAAATRPWVDVRDFGTAGNARCSYTGVATASSTTFTDANGGFTSADVGKTIRIYGAGTGGATHVTTITARTSGTAVTLAAATVTTVATAAYVVGTDDTAAIQAAISSISPSASSAGSSQGGTVFLPAGNYLVTNLVQKAGVTIAGAGWKATTLIATASSGYVLGVNGLSHGTRMSNAHVRDLTIAPMDIQFGVIASRPACGGIDWSYTQWCSMSDVYIHNVAGIGLNLLETYDFTSYGSHIFFVGTDDTTPGIWMSDAAGTGSATNAAHFTGLHMENCPVMLRATSVNGTSIPFDNQFVGCKFEWDTTTIWGPYPGIIIESMRGMSFAACSFVADTNTVSGTTYPLFKIGGSTANSAQVASGITFDRTCLFNTAGSGGFGGTFRGYLMDLGIRAIDVSLSGHAQGWGYVNGSGVSQPLITNAGNPVTMDSMVFYACQAPLWDGSSLVATNVIAQTISAPSSTSAFKVFTNSRLTNLVLSGSGSFTLGVSMSNNSRVENARITSSPGAFFFSGTDSVVTGSQFSSVTTPYSGSGTWQADNFIDDGPTRAVVTVAASGTTYTVSDVTLTRLTDLTLSANCTITFPTARQGKAFTLLLRGGASSFTATLPGTVAWSGTAPSLTIASGARLLATFVSADGTNWTGSA